VGHIHGKRSLFASDRVVGESWREFLWQNLLGNIYPMMDIIAGKFSDDAGLGIVFPDDPHLSDWDYNRDIAERLAARVGINGKLPPFFNFPIGTMFWARPKALAPLFALGLQWSDHERAGMVQRLWNTQPRGRQKNRVRNGTAHADSDRRVEMAI